MNLTFLFKFIVVFNLLMVSGNGFSQCVSFARNIAKPRLAPFIHDGNFNATYMEEGESAELYKTFFEGEEYRLVVVAIESLPKLRIRVLDDQRNVLFDNGNHQYVQVWDFIAKATGTLTVHVKIPDNSQKTSVTGGCVAILFGVKSNLGKKK